MLAVTNSCVSANNYTLFGKKKKEETEKNKKQREKASLVWTSLMFDFFYIYCDGTKSAVTGLMHTQSKPSGEDLTVLSDHRRVKEFGMQIIREGCC